MPASTTVDRVTFAVQNVQSATKPRKTCKTQDALSRLVDGPLEACCDYTADCLSDVGVHPFFAAIHHAHIEHRPLVLSPDMIWAAVLQGFAQHIKNHAERFRSKLVSHQGKARIEVSRPDFVRGSPENPWAEVVAAFSAGVQRHVGDRYNALIPDFTTTGPVERTACEVILLDTFQPYFQYVCYAGCGIPEITLEGTLSDWQRLRAKLDALEGFDLNWWLRHVRRVVEEFCSAVSGSVNRTFWGNVYKHQSFYGTTTVNGWAVLLVPYLKNWASGSYTERNPVLDYPLDWHNESLPVTPETSGRRFGPEGKYPGVGTTSLPNGVSRAPITVVWKDRDWDEVEPLDLLGGFVGVTQDPETLALRPKLGWAVARPSDRDAVFRKLQSLDPSTPLDPVELDAVVAMWREVGGSEIPGDLVLLYKTCNGVSLPSGGRIRPVAQLETLQELVQGPHRSVGRAIRFADLPAGDSLAVSLSPEYDLESREYRWNVFRIASDATHLTGEEPTVAHSVTEFLKGEMRETITRGSRGRA